MNTTDLNRSIIYFDGANQFFFNSWTTIGSTFAEAELDSVWRTRINTALFDRQFNRTTKFPLTAPEIAFRKISVGNSADNVSLEIIVKSKISYKVNIGSMYMSYVSNGPSNITSFETFVRFFNSNDIQLNQFRIINNPTTIITDYHEIYNLGTIVSNVNRFDLVFRWVDIPPYATNADAFIAIREMNLFTQGQEISIPDDVEGDRFGFSFVAVEWWDILGHLQNFAWWIVNRSPIAPVFEWLEDYVITWVSGLITFITGVFRL